jgi:hypothetical protein
MPGLSNASQAYFPFGNGISLNNSVIQKLFPAVDFNGLETGAEFQEIVEINGGLWLATNAQYNTTTALSPTAANAWNQVLGTQPSYAIQFGADGGITRYSAAATLGSGLTPITFTVATFAIDGNLSVTGSITTGGGTPGVYSFQRNKIINGSMEIDQRNSGASITPTSGQYSVDRWKLVLSQASKVTAQQISLSPSLGVPAAFCTRVTSTSAYTSLVSDNFLVGQPIEANNIQELAFGAANALPITLSFWVRSSLTGTFTGSIVNTASTRSYIFTYTISAVNTFSYVTISIPGDVTGTWVLSGTGYGLFLAFDLGSGTNYAGTGNAWNAGNLYAITGQAKLVGTNGATLDFTCVQLETGSTATPFEQRLYGAELALCQRYCFLAGLQSYGGGNDPVYGPAYAQSATNAFAVIYFPTPMRALPTLTVLNLGTTNFQFNSVAPSSPSAITIALGTSLSVLLALTCTGLTPGAAGSFLSTVAGAGIIFSAEL